MEAVAAAAEPTPARMLSVIADELAMAARERESLSSALVFAEQQLADVTKQFSQACQRVFALRDELTASAEGRA